MKRFFSWLAMIACGIGFYIAQWLVFIGGAYLLSLYSACGPFEKIILLVFGGCAFLGLLLTPLFYGGVLTVSISNSIYATKKGARYLILGILIIIDSIWSIIYYINGGIFEPIFLCTFIYGIELIVFAKK